MTPSVPILLIGTAALLWLLLPLFACLDGRQTNRRTWSGMIGLGSLGLLCAAVAAFGRTEQTFFLPRPFYLAIVPVTFRLDSLSSWFLVIIAVVGSALSFYLPAYMDHFKTRADMRVFWAALPLLLLSMALVVLAANVQTFLIVWEVMSLSSFLLVATDHREADTRQAALIYLGATRVGTAFLAGGFLWAYMLTRSWTFSDWHLQGIQALGPGLLLLVGLGVKAGMWPFHLWLPIAHPAAPSPISALMSGVMVKTAIYMITRLFLFSPAFVHPAFGYILLILGAVGAFWGILFALLQQDIKRALAYSTVENIGLILIGLGGAIAAQGLGVGAAVTLGAGAALFHTLNHALFKSLLFLGAGAVDTATHTRDLSHLGGLGRRMPATFGLFTLGAAAICGLPPLNGFAGEWILYQGSLQMACSGADPVLRFCGVMMLGWIALVGALALAGFIRLLGVAFLGRPRSPAAEQAQEVGLGMRLGQLLLALGCVALGLAAPLALGLLERLTTPLAPAAAPLSSAWTLPLLPLLLALAATMGLLALWLGQAAQQNPVRAYITWECGFGDLTSRMQVTAASYSQPIARLFGSLYRYAVHRQIEGKHRRHFPEEIRVEDQKEAMLETRIYHPLVRWVNRVGDWVVRLQAGSIHLYLLTMFITLILLLAIGGLTR